MGKCVRGESIAAVALAGHNPAAQKKSKLGVERSYEVRVAKLLKLNCSVYEELYSEAILKAL